MYNSGDIHGIIRHLMTSDVVQFPLDGDLLTMRLLSNGRRFSICSVIFRSEGNFIPRGVRRFVEKQKKEQRGDFHFTIELDDEHNRVCLYFIGAVSHLSDEYLQRVFGAYLACARRWKSTLDEKGSGDLLPIPRNE